MLKVDVIGNATRDAELSQTATGKDVLVFGIAVERRGNTAKSKETEFFNVSIYGALATSAVKTAIKKGNRLYLRGDLVIRVHESEATGKTYVNKDIYVSEMEFLPRSPREEKPTEGA